MTSKEQINPAITEFMSSIETDLTTWDNKKKGEDESWDDWDNYLQQEAKKLLERKPVDPVLANDFVVHLRVEAEKAPVDGGRKDFLKSLANILEKE